MVKVADFGLAEDIYGYNYYKHDGRERVPIRWMAPRIFMYCSLPLTPFSLPLSPTSVGK